MFTRSLILRYEHLTIDFNKSITFIKHEYSTTQHYLFIMYWPRVVPVLVKRDN